MKPFYLLRAVGGTLYLVGMLMLVINVLLTVTRGKPIAASKEVTA